MSGQPPTPQPEELVNGYVSCSFHGILLGVNGKSHTVREAIILSNSVACFRKVCST